MAKWFDYTEEMRTAGAFDGGRRAAADRHRDHACATTAASRS